MAQQAQSSPPTTWTDDLVKAAFTCKEVDDLDDAEKGAAEEETEQPAAIEISIILKTGPATSCLNARVQNRLSRTMYKFMQIDDRIKPSEDQKTVTAEWYTNNCLPLVLEKVREKRPRSRILLYHDNASSHTARRTIDYLVTSDVELLGHLPYSPDLAPCDFYLFPKIKEKLQGKLFMNTEEAVGAFQKAVEETPKDEWAKCFSQWFHQMQRYIDAFVEVTLFLHWHAVSKCQGWPLLVCACSSAQSHRSRSSIFICYYFLMYLSMGPGALNLFKDLSKRLRDTQETEELAVSSLNASVLRSSGEMLPASLVPCRRLIAPSHGANQRLENRFSMRSLVTPMAFNVLTLTYSCCAVYSSSSAQSSSAERHNERQLATCIHRSPATLTMSQVHLVGGLPTPRVVGSCAGSARIATTILLANPAVKQQCWHCCVSAWRVVGPCAWSARIATTIFPANPAVKQQCLHCCVSAWREIGQLLWTALLIFGCCTTVRCIAQARGLRLWRSSRPPQDYYDYYFPSSYDLGAFKRRLVQVPVCSDGSKLKKCKYCHWLNMDETQGMFSPNPITTKSGSDDWIPRESRELFKCCSDAYVTNKSSKCESDSHTAEYPVLAEALS
ncbi:hypothetical protein MSG28_009551 [Choristoneura fumiferana]|uniref:Uncharacterized protein n=1 Tax=Choristoneura fumiferana TaxID=7141 RepID=A0ACC0JBI6_CHOFU|nr:hypothetical protein MSG28_009551 [Choristoneura fumiferana]